MASKKKLKRRNKKLQRKLWSVKRDRKFTVRDLEMYRELCQDLEAENTLLKKPKITAHINGQPVEVKVRSDDS